MFDEFVLLCRDHGLPEPTREYEFAKATLGRKWRFDYVFLETTPPLAIEQEGGSWTGGRHTRGAGFEKDCIKYGHAFAMGYVVLRVTPKMLRDGTAIKWIQQRLALTTAQ